MTLYELIKKYGSDKGQEAMWKTTEFISKYTSKLDAEDYECLIHDIAGFLLNGHYDEHFADEQVAKLYYVYDNIKHTGPFIPKDTVLQTYDNVRSRIKDYNKWDFYVTVQMIYSDNYTLLHKWFQNISDEELKDKVFDLAINWLDDEDNPFGNKKIWCYFNCKK